MRKSTTFKAAFQFLSLLLCLVLIPVAFAQPDELTGSINYENGTFDSSTIPGLVSVGGNYTVHSINPTYYSVFLMPGKSETFNVSFRNEGNETVNVAPKIVALPDSSYILNESWITISPPGKLNGRSGYGAGICH